MRVVRVTETNTANCTGDAKSLNVTVLAECIVNGLEYESSSLVLYPNPTSDIIKVSRDFNGNAEFSVVDLLGQTVIKGGFSSQSEIDVSSLQPGLYVIHLKLENKTYKGTFTKF